MWFDLTNSELNTQHPKPPPKQRKVSTQVISFSFLVESFCSKVGIESLFIPPWEWVISFDDPLMGWELN
jgi:hypothetical protein